MSTNANHCDNTKLDFNFIINYDKMTMFVDSSVSFMKRQVAVANIRMVVTSVMAMETEDEPDSLEVQIF